MKALIIFVVLAGFVIFDGEGAPQPKKTHSDRTGFHNPTIAEPLRMVKQKVAQVVPRRISPVVQTLNRTTLNTEVPPMLDDHWPTRCEHGCGPPLRI